MTGAAVPVTVEPGDHPLAAGLAAHAAAAAEHLELGRWLRGITLILDDLAADERPWLSLAGDAGDRSLALYLHQDALTRDRAGSTARPPADAAWTLRRPPGAEVPVDPAAFSPVKAQRLLHHQFLWARDICDGTLVLADVPASLAEPFQEAWAASVDGRLRRAGLPSLGEGERRMRFLRVFATGAVITPAHWRVFQEVWSGEAAGTAEILRRVKRLPAPRRTGAADA